jgi:hypothetical protein
MGVPVSLRTGDRGLAAHLHNAWQTTTTGAWHSQRVWRIKRHHGTYRAAIVRFQGKTALVTGGSRGLGLQMAHALGEAGARIVLSSRKAKDLEQAAAELQARALTPAGLPPTAPARTTSSAWQGACSAWAMWTFWSTTPAPAGAPAEDHPLAPGTR